MDKVNLFLELIHVVTSRMPRKDPRDDPGYADYLYEQQRDRDKEQVDEH